MHEILTSSQMREADRRAIAGGVPGIALMEAAGRAVAEAASRLVPAGPALVLAGPGNNGGDGFVAARLLAEAGREVSVFLLGDPERLTGDARLAFERWARPASPATADLPPAAVVIDALFGTGLQRPLTGLPADLVAAMDRHPAPVIAVDVPSGLDADSGQPLGAAPRAAATVTFFRPKPGHLLYPGRALCGALTLADIGIPDAVLDGLGVSIFENTPELWPEAPVRPSSEGHKYNRGHAIVVSGPLHRTGAARLAADAALRAGAGLVTLASPGSALAVNAAHLTAVMLARVNDAAALATLLADPRHGAVALGPGLGTGADQRALVLAALASPAAAVLDADALTAFAADPETLFAAIGARAAPVILTPHDGEFARLFPDLAALPAKTERAAAAAARSGATLILKGADSVIAAPDGRLAINGNAPPWLATAGSGDVLAGIAAGLAAQRLPGWPAAAAAVWLHGAAGAEAGPGLIAEDLAPALRPVLATLWRAREDRGPPTPRPAVATT
ncbi:NAD(P)H-hydrate dehydratase [uncultured Amaricoccus sp.]|uniref:NAD(P)H-hydrate dehydratase n=1 Tax=uncultured Amaricoccus sp. TaxID=339341 RepID=UPI0026202D7C|nr:NAD(P)H-hydrate dehydratase [uncultured Amaricoccus sp.]